MEERRAEPKDLLVDARKTLFLVDRSDSFIMYMRILLERMGFRVRNIESAERSTGPHAVPGPDQRPVR